MRKIIALLALTLLLVAGCSQPAPDVPTEAPETTEPPVEPPEPPKGPFEEVGEWLFDTLASFGYYDLGAGEYKSGVELGHFSWPTGLDEDLGLLYVAEEGNHRVQVLTVEGEAQRFIGERGVNPGQLFFPTDVDAAGDRVYVADKANHRISIFDTDGEFISSFGSRGGGDGQLVNPYGIAVYGDSVFVSDEGNHRIQVFTTGGDFLFSFGEKGSEDGQIQFPRHLFVDDTGVYVADYGNHRISIFSHEGEFERVIGGADQEFLLQMDSPVDVVRAGDYLIVSEEAKHRVQVLDLEEGVSIVKVGEEGVEEGSFRHPHGITLDGTTLFVADRGNHRLQSFQLV